MRRPLPLNTPFKVAAQVGLRRRECAVFIGAIIAEWSTLEVLMATSYALLTCGVEEPGGPNIEHWIAIETFETFRGYRDKRRVLMSAAVRRGFCKSVLNDLNALLGRIQDAGDNRIDAAHGRWVISDKYPEALIFFRNAAKIQVLDQSKQGDGAYIYSPTDFKESLDEITALARELQEFYEVALLPPIQAMIGGRVVDAVSVRNSSNRV